MRARREPSCVLNRPLDLGPGASGGISGRPAPELRRTQNLQHPTTEDGSGPTRPCGRAPPGWHGDHSRFLCPGGRSVVLDGGSSGRSVGCSVVVQPS